MSSFSCGTYSQALIVSRPILLRSSHPRQLTDARRQRKVTNRSYTEPLTPVSWPPASGIGFVHQLHPPKRNRRCLPSLPDTTAFNSSHFISRQQVKMTGYVNDAMHYERPRTLDYDSIAHVPRSSVPGFAAPGQTEIMAPTFVNRPMLQDPVGFYTSDNTYSNDSSHGFSLYKMGDTIVGTPWGSFYPEPVYVDPNLRYPPITRIPPATGYTPVFPSQHAPHRRNTEPLKVNTNPVAVPRRSETDPGKVPSGETYDCHKCGKPFTALSGQGNISRHLKHHCKATHNSHREKLECKRCGKTFTRPDALKKHNKVYH
ncbi:hypothetical protein BU23DRAFT_636123 [Bimuria novae-zelandiae CBS 107.79]|uniref:C2H2-type domain-containing protein n=1 Tax=Bimuria novae-zelandiae CBS 107.79 TaxID=1447943 RepID=A0A6A5VBL1_9PLEO|nr:hypothetical protein BU23DRAFT_636123 [Bimuria novae-zelandiae CBS 107.79]